MLTSRQIKKIAEDDWSICFKRGYHPLGYKGLNMPDKEEIRIYLPAHESKKDLAITIIHELIHERDDLRMDAARKGAGADLNVRENTEEKVEREAEETYRRNPKIIEFIKAVYNLDKI